MMEYKKIESNGYILAVTTCIKGGNISLEEYDVIVEAMKNAPKKEGYSYKLRSDLTYEEVKIQDYSAPDLTSDEVLSIVIGCVLKTATIDDKTALRMVSFYPEWTADTEYHVNDKVKYNDILYRCLQNHFSQEPLTPISAEDFWIKVVVTDDNVSN